MASPTADRATKEPRSLGSCLLWAVAWVVVLGALAYGLLIFLLVLGMSVFGERALEDGDDTYRLSITVADGEPGRVVRFGESDVEQLELVRGDWELDPYRRGNTQVSVDTGFTNDEMSDGYCFADAVTIVGSKGKGTLVEAGECVDRSGRLDRRTVEIVAPAADARVGDSVEVDTRLDVNRPENLSGATLRFYVNGVLARETSAYSSTGNVLDLTAVAPGPMTIRVELEGSAAVVDLVRVPSG